MVQKACRLCKAVVEEGGKCPLCGSEELTESFKGKVTILNPEKSEIAKNIGQTKKGKFAIKLG